MQSKQYSPPTSTTSFCAGQLSDLHFNPEDIENVLLLLKTDHLTLLLREVFFNKLDNLLEDEDIVNDNTSETMGMEIPYDPENESEVLMEY